MGHTEEWLLPIPLFDGTEGRTALGELVIKRLRFTQQTQETGQWCWAAVASSIALYYAPRSVWIQCWIASALFRHDCCKDRFSPTCNRSFALNEGMRCAGILQWTTPRDVPFDTLMRAIDANQPVGIGITWHTGSGHAVSVSGYSFDPVAGVHDMWIRDPWPGVGPCSQNYGTFPSYYGGGGRWTETDLSFDRGDERQ